MKKHITLLIIIGCMVAGCIVAEPPPGPVRGDRDRDGVPNRVDRDRDGDGVRNSQDRRPNDPRRY
ncbi:MAG TPA: hypothetical protein VK642_08180 [Burkholderiales bacterium]|nr:hypothetical protein [Burkholderiales bacterium]